MQILFIIITIITTIAVSKYAIINSLFSRSQLEFKVSLGFLLLPFSFLNKSQQAVLQSFYKIRTIYFIEALSIVFAVFHSLILIKFALLNSGSIPIPIVYLIFLIFIHFGLTYLSVFDLLTLSVPAGLTRFLLFISIIVSIFFSISQLFLQTNPDTNISLLGRPDNLIGFLISFSYAFFLVKISKEKFMGEGDIYIFGIIGLILGFQSSVIFLLLFPILGTVYGIANGLILNKFKSLLVPLVPILYSTFLSILFYQEQIRSFLGF